MTISVASDWIISVYLISVRLSALFLMSPIFPGLAKFVAVKTLFILSLSTLLVSILTIKSAVVPSDLGSLMGATISELLVGATLAFGIFAAFASFSIAGKILDVQTGFGIGAVFDPVTRASAPIFATILNLLAVAVFFGMNGHHALLRGIAFSLQQMPLGAGISSSSGEAMIRQFGTMFSLAIALIAPVIFSLFLIEVGMAVLSRMLPQMNAFIVGIPIKILVGVAVFALTVGSLGEVMGRVYASIFSYWEQVLR